MVQMPLEVSASPQFETAHALPYCYAFEPFVLDPARRLLAQNGRPVRMTARCFDLLLLLIQHRHRMLSREELFQALWPDVCVEDANLTVNLSLVRKALGENTRQPRFIETLPRRGYRFVAEVVQTSPPPATRWRAP